MVNNSAYTLYLREDWKKLSDFTAIQLSEEELMEVQSINEKSPARMLTKSIFLCPIY